MYKSGFHYRQHVKHGLYIYRSVLSEDKTILVCYPAARGTSSYLIGENVKKIDSYAFDGVTGLSKINYPGSAQSFQHIEIGVGNTAFVSLPVTCNFKGK